MMKKKIVWILAAVMLVTLAAGCAKDEPVSTQPTESDIQPQEENVTEATVNVLEVEPAPNEGQTQPATEPSTEALTEAPEEETEQSTEAVAPEGETEISFSDLLGSGVILPDDEF